MNLHSIRWRLPLSYIAIALLAALASGLMMLAVLRDYYQQREREYVIRNAVPIALAAEQLLQAVVPDVVVADQVKAWSFLLQARVQVFNADGSLLADSGTPDSQHILMVSNAGVGMDVPEMPSITQSSSVSDTGAFTASLPRAAGIFLMPAAPPGTQGDVIVLSDCFPNETCMPGVAVRADEAFVPITATEQFTQPIAVSMSLGGSTSGFEMVVSDEIYQQRSSIRVEQTLQNTAGNPIGRLVISEGPAYGAEIFASVAWAWAIASLIALAVAGAAGWLVSRRITAPVLHLTDVTTRMADGDLAARSGADTPDEFGALGRSFDQMAEQIEGLVGTLRRFVADAAHELNTPITALQTDLEMARTTADTVERSLLMDRVTGQISRLQGLVRSLLDLSRLEGQTNLPVRQPVDLAELAQNLAEVYASRAEQAGINFELALPGEPAVISGDPTQLNVAIANLLDNAIKFTPPGGTARLRLEKLDAQVFLSVEDTGIGILAEDLPLLFQRFHRGRNSAAYPGNGLGLAIVKAIVNAHGGTIQAGNTDHGAVFILQLS
ncbi:MAG: sensor histidine kinase [Chloroflexota bacterium]